MANTCVIKLSATPVAPTTTAFSAGGTNTGSDGDFVDTAFRKRGFSMLKDDAMGVFNPGEDMALVRSVPLPRSIKRRFPIHTRTLDFFVGAHHIFQGQVTNVETLARPIYYLPVFIQSRPLCLADAKQGEPNLLSIPLLSAPQKAFTSCIGEHLDYRIYTDVMRPCSKIIDDGVLYTLVGITGPLSVTVSKDDRVGIGDVVFVTIGDDSRPQIRLFIVTAVEPFETHDVISNLNPDGTVASDSHGLREVEFKPFKLPPDTTYLSSADAEAAVRDYMLPERIGKIGWVDTDYIDAYEETPSPEELKREVEASIEKITVTVYGILDQYATTDLPAHLFMAGISAPIQPTQFEAWKSVVNVTVHLNGNATVLLDSEFYTIAPGRVPWCPGDSVEMQLGLPLDTDPSYVEYNSINSIDSNTVRLELRYCRPGAPPPSRWATIVWRAVVGKFMIEEAHGYYYACQLAIDCQKQLQKRFIRKDDLR